MTHDPQTSNALPSHPPRAEDDGVEARPAVVALPGVVLYERKMPHGPLVRIRRTSEDGVQPIRLVLEVDRRAGTPRAAAGGTPPPLRTLEGDDEAVLCDELRPLAQSDAEVARLLREKGYR